MKHFSSSEMTCSGCSVSLIEPTDVAARYEGSRSRFRPRDHRIESQQTLNTAAVITAAFSIVRADVVPALHFMDLMTTSERKFYSLTRANKRTSEYLAELRAMLSCTAFPQRLSVSDSDSNSRSHSALITANN